MSIELVMPSNRLILCLPLLLLPSVFPSIRVFSNEGRYTADKVRRDSPIQADMSLGECTGLEGTEVVCV